MNWETHLRRVVDAATAVDGVPPLNEEALLELARSGLDGADLQTADEGFALVRDGHLDLVVVPSARRSGVGTELLERVLAENPSELTAWSHGDHPGARALAGTHDFDPVRSLWLLRRESAPVEPVTSPVEIRTFEHGDEGELLAVNAAAFADHPEQGSLSMEGLHQRMAEPWFDPQGLFVAVRDGTIRGFHWTKVHPDGTGEVYVVGIAPQAQGLGLGRALVVRGLQHLEPRDVMLYVESDNTSAVRLYESLGFTHEGTDVQYVRPAQP